MASSTVPHVVFIVGDRVGWGAGYATGARCASGTSATSRAGCQLIRGFDGWFGMNNTSDGAAEGARPKQSIGRYRNATPGEDFNGYSG